ncbi:MAG: Na+/H+ antiporter NhaA [Phycisphaerales bacterium]|nr:MAG: Na+/H+ antiporter NhaA [Phycisphaerales bacterium]
MAARDSSRPAAADRPIDWVLRPFQEFLHAEASGGIVLLACTAAALIWANSPWRQSYHDFWHTYVSLGFGQYVMKESLVHWVNDGLMAIFFFVVGLEIKREVLVGELASLRKAAIPIAAAVGGMAVPAGIYVLFNLGRPGIEGWAIPAATDIAFALGAIALLGPRVPTPLKVFLTALAIADDIAAVLIIAVFYTSDVSFAALLAAGVILGLLIVANAAGVRRPMIYVLLGIALWLAFFESGVHATVAGVVLALTIPARCRIRGVQFATFAKRALTDFENAGADENDIMTNPRRQAVIHGLEEACEQVHTPLLRMEHGLHPWVSYLIMPVFALANAGVSLGQGAAAAVTSSVGLGVLFGLLIGKQIGVTLATWAAVKGGVGQLPAETTWRQIYGTGWLAGIGFTMSLFIANLSFEDDPVLLESAKIGILAASLAAGVLGFALLRMATAKR